MYEICSMYFTLYKSDFYAQFHKEQYLEKQYVLYNVRILLLHAHEFKFPMPFSSSVAVSRAIYFYS
jgi:hypothetical protein